MIGSLLRPRPQTPAILPRVHLPATSPQVALVRGLQWVITLVSLISLGLAGSWWDESAAIEEDAARYAVAVARAEARNQQFTEQMKREGLTLTADQMAIVKRDVAFVNQLSDKRFFSWVRLLNDLEETISARVSIASIMLNFQESTVSLQGVALSLQDLNAFVTGLQAHRAFRKAVLVSHHVQQGTGQSAGKAKDGATSSVEPSPSRSVEFSMTVIYRPMF